VGSRDNSMSDSRGNVAAAGIAPLAHDEDLRPLIRWYRRYLEEIVGERLSDFEFESICRAIAAVAE
jgi:hypothetical protein